MQRKSAWCWSNRRKEWWEISFDISTFWKSFLQEEVSDAAPFGGSHPPPPGAAPTRRVTLTEFSDIMIAESTLPGYVAMRNKNEGSWFIQELCQVQDLFWKKVRKFIRAYLGVHGKCTWLFSSWNAQKGEHPVKWEGVSQWFEAVHGKKGDFFRVQMIFKNKVYFITGTTI